MMKDRMKENDSDKDERTVIIRYRKNKKKILINKDNDREEL